VLNKCRNCCLLTKLHELIEFVIEMHNILNISFVCNKEWTLVDNDGNNQQGLSITLRHSFISRSFFESSFIYGSSGSCFICGSSSSASSSSISATSSSAPSAELLLPDCYFYCWIAAGAAAGDVAAAAGASAASAAADAASGGDAAEGGCAGGGGGGWSCWVLGVNF